MKLLSLCLAWVAGVCLGSVASLSAWTAGLIAAAALAAVAGVTLAAATRGRRTGWLMAGLCLASLVVGVAWWGVRVHPANIGQYAGRTVLVEGEVVRGTEYGGAGAWLGVSARRVSWGGCSQPASGQVVVYTDPFPAYSQGDVLSIEGEIRPVTEIENTGYRDFLVRQGFAGTVSDPAGIELLGRSWLFSVRDRLAGSLRVALAEPQASLAEGLLLGVRSHLPEGLKSDFSRTGTSHLLAISGFNLALIGGGVLGAAARVFGRERSWYLVVTLAAVWMYSALTGMQPPVLRAAIMFSLLLAGLWLGRPGSAITALGLAGAVMAALDPRVVRDVSFQLSFASVAGLVLLQPRLQQWGERVIPEGRWPAPVARPVFTSVAVGLSAIVAALPLLAYHFQSISLVGLPATVAASAFVSVATVTAGATAVVGLFWPGAARVVGYVASFFLMCIVGVVEAFARAPLASIGTGSVPVGLVWAYYLLLAGAVGRRRLKSAAAGAARWAWRLAGRLADAAWRLPRKRTAGLLVLGACLAWTGFASVPGDRLQVSFLDVGQGDAILIITPSGQQILIDGGPDPDTVCQRLGEELPFWDKSLDMVVLTHCHDDHLAGLMGVLDRYEVGRVLESGFGSGPLYRLWLERVEGRGVPLTVARSGQEIDLGEDMVLEVVHPSDRLLQGTVSEANSNSIILRLVWNEVSFLLAGDADMEAEEDVLHGGVVRDLRSDVLKVGHHGSGLSTSPAFLAAVQPEVAVICVGAGNPFGHPAEETLAVLNGVDLYRTDEQGTISFSTDGKRLWVGTSGPTAD